jgi:hypothetical protein
VKTVLDDGLWGALVREGIDDDLSLGLGDLDFSVSLSVLLRIAPFAIACNHRAFSPTIVCDARNYSMKGRGFGIRRTYVEAWTRGPDGLALSVADDGFVNVASADEAVG